MTMEICSSLFVSVRGVLSGDRKTAGDNYALYATFNSLHERIRWTTQLSQPVHDGYFWTKLISSPNTVLLSVPSNY